MYRRLVIPAISCLPFLVTFHTKSNLLLSALKHNQATYTRSNYCSWCMLTSVLYPQPSTVCAGQQTRKVCVIAEMEGARASMQCKARINSVGAPYSHYYSLVLSDGLLAAISTLSCRCAQIRLMYARNHSDNTS